MVFPLKLHWNYKWHYTVVCMHINPKQNLTIWKVSNMKPFSKVFSLNIQQMDSPMACTWASSFSSLLKRSALCSETFFWTSYSCFSWIWIFLLTELTYRNTAATARAGHKHFKQLILMMNLTLMWWCFYQTHPFTWETAQFDFTIVIFYCIYCGTNKLRFIFRLKGGEQDIESW